MNEDSFSGEARDIAGKVKETVGDVTGTPSLQVEGLGDQLGGKAQKLVGAARDAFADGPLGEEPLADKARRLAQERPWAAAALLGFIALALFLPFRGKRKPAPPRRTKAAPRKVSNLAASQPKRATRTRKA